VHDAPIAFTGSDGATHLVYELGMTNFSSGNVFVQKVEVLGDGAVLQMLDTAAVASRLQRVGVREPAGVLAKSTQALLFLNVILPNGAAIPLKFRIASKFRRAPRSGGPILATACRSIELVAPSSLISWRRAARRRIHICRLLL
jgi:hypothetical protein